MHLRSSRPVPGLSLPEDVINEAEAAWSKVVAAVKRVHSCDILESQFFPLFAENVMEVQRLEGEKPLLSFRFLEHF